MKNTKLKLIICILTMLSLVFATPIFANATTYNSTQNSSPSKEIIDVIPDNEELPKAEQDNATNAQLPISSQTATIYNEEQLKDNALIYGGESNNPDSLISPKKAILTHKVGILLVRSGNTTKVNVYIHYTSPYYTANIVKMSSLKIMTSTQKTTYKSFGSVYKTFPAGKSRYIYLGNAKIPKSVKKAYVKGTGISVYTLKKGWLSVTNAAGLATIQ